MTINPTSNTNAAYIPPTTTGEADKTAGTQTPAPSETDAAKVPSGYRSDATNGVYTDPPKAGAQTTGAYRKAAQQLGDTTPFNPFAMAEALFKLLKTLVDSNREQRLADSDRQIAAINNQGAKMKAAAEKEYSAAKASANAQIIGGAIQGFMAGAGMRALAKNANWVNMGATTSATRNAMSQAWTTWGQAASGLATGVGQRVAADDTYNQRQLEAEQKLAQADETKAQTAYQQSNDFANNAAQVRKSIMDIIAAMADREYQTGNKIGKDLA